MAEAEVRVMWPQAKGSRQLLEAEKGQETNSHLDSPKKHHHEDTLILA